MLTDDPIDDITKDLATTEPGHLQDMTSMVMLKWKFVDNAH